MKTLAIILILLFTIPAFANDNFISIFESDGVVYVIDITPEEYVPPEPVNTDVERPKQIPNPFKKMNVLDWLIGSGVLPTGLP